MEKKSLLSTKSCRLATMMVLTASFFLVELIVGYITHSLALVADSFHMLSDIISLIVGFVAVRYAKRETPKNTYGWQRAEVVGALVNAVFLFALCFTILVDAVERLVSQEHLERPQLVLIVGGIGLAVNLLGILLFSTHGMSHGHSHGGGGHSHKSKSKGHSHESKSTEDPQSGSEETSRANGVGNRGCDGRERDVEAGEEARRAPNSESEGVKTKAKEAASASQLNMRGVFLHVLGDALGSVVVIISALIIMFVDSDWVFLVDPVLSIVIVIIISTSTWPLFKQSSMILLQSIPTGIDIADIDKKLRNECTSIDNIHEFHVWQLTGDKLIATLHISVSSLEEYSGVIEQATRILHQEGIHSTTIQPEFLWLKQKSEKNCPIPCPTDTCSDKNKCCSNTRRQTGGSKSAPSLGQLQMEVSSLECSTWERKFQEHSRMCRLHSSLVGAKLATHTDPGDNAHHRGSNASCLYECNNATTYR